ncbi:hypothetical protein [Desulfobacca acetoxidans]|uniref:Putative proton-dependent oligopeptide transport protein n=1 Tax=Desulfobacca acetoxidans (strain ATCC 700848 / DSM 11109 / ASRB2) TaxID=880072 RepID=F2NEK3_DESAR|nr:hypothetical protein [Desulfobacca acetoxidans]AEB08193.1 putative proton-dependent oligopeptide transport protein [Desulfobacca acetoxidans DSM 11109]
MEHAHLGSLLALIGMILLLVVNFNRRSARRRRVWTGTDIAVQKYGSLVAYAILALGLLLLLGRRAT